MNAPFQPDAFDALLFDLDGTLIDSERDLTDAVVEAFRAAGFAPPPPERVVPLLGAPLEEMPALLGLAMTPADGERVLAAFRAWYPAHWTDHTAPYPGVPEALAALASRYALAVVTTKRQTQASRITEALALAPYFRHVQGFADGLRHKPAPDLPRAALEALGVPPGRAVMIGDTFRDIRAGKAAGCATVGVTYGAGSEESLGAEGPDALAGSVAALAALFGI